MYNCIPINDEWIKKRNHLNQNLSKKQPFTEILHFHGSAFTYQLIMKKLKKPFKWKFILKSSRSGMFQKIHSKIGLLNIFKMELLRHQHFKNYYFICILLPQKNIKLIEKQSYLKCSHKKYSNIYSKIIMNRFLLSQKRHNC